jgi:hypothetical protein
MAGGRAADPVTLDLYVTLPGAEVLPLYWVRYRAQRRQRTVS